MSEEQKLQRQQQRAWQSSVRTLLQMTKALRQLSGISVTLTKRTRRQGKYLRSLLRFDEMNRLDAPVKGSERSRRSRRRGTSRRGTSRRSAGRGFGWDLGALRQGLGALGRLLGKLWERLRLFWTQRKLPVLKGFEALTKAGRRLAGLLKGALGWGYERILKPLARWTLDRAAAALVRALAAGMELLSTALEGLGRVFGPVWDGVFAPLLALSGDLIVGALDLIQGAFTSFSDVLERLTSLHPLEWLNEELLDPFRDFHPLLTLQIAWETGPQDLFNAFREKWEANPAVQSAVELVRGGWSTVKSWVETALGGGVEKAVTLAREGWSTVKGWVETALGGGVEKAVSLTRSGWSSVRDWAKNHLGGTLEKAVSLTRSGWSSVRDWAKNHLGGTLEKGVALTRSGWSSVADWVRRSHLGKGVSCVVKLVKGWSGGVAKFLGLDKLAAKFTIKLPKVEVSWSKGKLPLPSFSLKWNALGGILNGPTLFGASGSTLLGGGEAGREAIVPLERNTGWMDQLADRLTQRMGGAGTQPLRVQVVLDGQVVAESTVRALRSMARAGRRPLRSLL